MVFLKVQNSLSHSDSVEHHRRSEDLLLACIAIPYPSAAMTVPTLLRCGEPDTLPSSHSQENLTGSHRAASVGGKDSLFAPV